MADYNKSIQFLLNEYIPILTSLDPSTPPVFGKMNVQQMIEHMSDMIRMGNGKDPHTVITPEDKLPAMMEFLMSDKEFKPNTKNRLMGEEPAPVRNPSVKQAISELNNEISDLIKHFDEEEGRRVPNPFFGNMNKEEWIQLLHKHAIHHLKQFNVATV
jgi:hypothetical protein